MASSYTATHNVQSFPRGYERSTAMQFKDQQSQKKHKLDPTTKEKYFDKWTNFRMKMNKGLIEMINNPRLKKRIDKGAVPFFRADKNMCHFALDQATEEYLEGRKLKPTLMAETFVEFGIPRAQLAPSESQVGSDMNNNSQIGIASQHPKMKHTKKLERKDRNETYNDPTPIPKPRKKKKHRDYVDGGKVDGYRYNEVLSPVTASGIPRDAKLYVNTSREDSTTLREGDQLLYNLSPKEAAFPRVQQPLYVNIPQNSSPVRNQTAFVNTRPIIQPSNPSDDFVPLGKSNYLPHRYLPNFKPELENDDDTVTAISTEPDFEELSQFRAHGHNKRAPPPPPPVPPHRTPMPTYVNQMDISSELSSTSRPLSRYTGDSIGGSMFGRRQDSTLTGKLSAVQWSNRDSNAVPSRNRKTSLRSYNTHATWKTTGTFIAKRHPEDAGVDEMTFGNSEYVIDNASNRQNSIMIMDGVNGENRSTFESELLY